MGVGASAKITCENMLTVFDLVLEVKVTSKVDARSSIGMCEVADFLNDRGRFVFVVGGVNVYINDGELAGNSVTCDGVNAPGSIMWWVMSSNS